VQYAAGERVDSQRVVCDGGAEVHGGARLEQHHVEDRAVRATTAHVRGERGDWAAEERKAPLRMHTHTNTAFATVGSRRQHCTSSAPSAAARDTSACEHAHG
jgi:hypothetical protein